MRRAIAEWRLKSLRDDTGTIPADAFSRTLPPALDGVAIGGLDSSKWESLGPANFGGRCRSINLDPDEPGKMLAGSVSGGLWVTTDYGQNWSPINDKMANLAVTSIVRDPVNPTHLYASTGEFLVGANRGSGIFGAGIFKSTDDGQTWTAQTPASATSQGIYRLAISPNGSTLLAATAKGLYRSTNAGVSWTIVAGNFFYQATPYIRHDYATCFDVQFHPRNPNKAVMAFRRYVEYDVFGGPRKQEFQSGVVYSSDGGATWGFSQNINANQAAGFRTEVYYHGGGGASDGVVYALREFVPRNPAVGPSLWRSTNDGQSFSLVASNVVNDAMQGWYDLSLWVNPDDVDANTTNDHILVGGVNLARSLNGGSTFTQISDDLQPPSAHDDHHMMVELPPTWILPDEDRPLMFCTDGGIYYTSNYQTVSISQGWESRNNGLEIAQFYGGHHGWISGNLLGGTQDNGSLLRTPSGGKNWMSILGGDGGFPAITSDELDYYVQSQFLGVQHRNPTTGVLTDIAPPIGNPRIQWSPPIAVMTLDPNDNNILVAGSFVVWKYDRTRQGTGWSHPHVNCWTSIRGAVGTDFVSAVEIADGDSQHIWVGYDSGRVSHSTDGGVNWTDRILPSTPARFVTSIKVDPNDLNRVFVTFGGFRSGNIRRGTKPGATWNWTTLASTPSVPVRDIEIHRSNPTWLYAATELGLIVSENDGATWVTATIGPANVSIDDLFWSGGELYLMTHGRGAFRQRPEIAVAAPVGPRCVGIAGAGTPSASQAPKLRATPPKIGQTMTFTLSLGVPGSAAVVSLGPPAAPALVNTGCYYMLNPATMISLAGVTLDAQGFNSGSQFLIPNDQALIGVQWMVQALAVSPGTSPTTFVSNGLLLTVGQ